MFRKAPIKTRLVFVLSVLLFAYAPCFATTYYVRSDGSNSNNGLSDATAWRTLRYASSRLTAGDTLLLKRGHVWIGSQEGGGEDGLIYIENKNNVTIDAYGTGPKPVIDRSSENDAVPDALYPDYTCIEIRGSSQNTAVRNLDLRGAYHTAAIFVNASPTTTLSTLEVRGSGWQEESLLIVRSLTVVMDCLFDTITSNSEGYGKAIEFRTDDCVVRESVFRGFGMGGAVRWSNGGDNGIVERNFFYQPDTRQQWAWAIVVRSQDGGKVIIRDNVIDMTRHGSLSGSNLRGMAFWDDHGPVTRKIFNNTIVSDGAGYGVHSGGSTNLGYNNIFYDLETGWNNIPNGTTSRNNLFFSCNSKFTDGTPSEFASLTGDPNLVDPTMSGMVPTDAGILLPSPAQDSGYASDTDVSQLDFLNQIRPVGGGIDIGAFEYSSSSLSPPRNLRIVTPN